MTKKNVLTKIVVPLTYPIELSEWDTAVSFEWDKTKLANGISHISRTNAPQWDIPLRKKGQTPKERKIQLGTFLKHRVPLIDYILIILPFRIKSVQNPRISVLKAVVGSL